MTHPTRLRLSRAKGFNLQAHSLATNGLPARSVARPGPFGNPWHCIRPVVGCPGAAGYDGPAHLRCCVHRFGSWMRLGIAMAQVGCQPSNADEVAVTAIARRLPELRGHNLACWCPLPEPGQPDHCHAAVLLEIANG